MKKLILILFVFVFILNSLSALNYYYEINLSQNGTNLFLKNINVEIGNIKENQTSYGDSLLKVFSFDGENLYDTKFESYRSAIREGDLGKGYFESEIIYYNFTEINLQIPYYENANEIIIYDANLTEKLIIDVSMYSKISEEELEREKLEVVKEEAEREEREKEAGTFTEKLSKNWWVLVVILIILILILIKRFKKRK